MVSTGYTFYPHHVSFSEMLSSIAVQTTILESILFISFTVATILILLPHEYVKGSPVPIIVFKGHPATFHAFTICIIFAFSGAFCALMTPNSPRIARLCGCYSIASMASAIGLLIWAVRRGDHV
ncbi:hypothetical protein QQP08_006377 [Theobroma cacao]|nr:hypothetical protein QQP08_006377 [Theobroma cacao]